MGIWGLPGGDPRKLLEIGKCLRQEKEQQRASVSRVYFGYLELKSPEAFGAREQLAVFHSLLPEEGGAGHSSARLPEVLIFY